MMRKIQSSSSTENSVSIYFKDTNTVIRAIRQNDGTVTREVTALTRENNAVSDLTKILIGCTILRELGLICLHKLFFHIPTIFIILVWIITIINYSHNTQSRMMHGAEHKVLNWYIRKNKSRSIKDYSRIDMHCGTNLLATILTFQIVASASYLFWNFHIPETITMLVPYIAYKIIPFNLLGLITQLFFTTKEPEDEHIEVALSVFFK